MKHFGRLRGFICFHVIGIAVDGGGGRLRRKGCDRASSVLTRGKVQEVEHTSGEDKVLVCRRFELQRSGYISSVVHIRCEEVFSQARRRIIL